ncbi:NFX1-type zinc finger-containing protein 1-like [Macrobrachium nipponense]|uniref:NFX1-type zinc finger-containing protein 1-like n=1 Tax=Macrobrachium nipponense TaxID=159736 RepID=UPI0030C7E900
MEAHRTKMNGQQGPKPGIWCCENCRWRNQPFLRQCQKCNVFKSDHMRRVPFAGNTRTGQRRQRSKTPCSQRREPVTTAGHPKGARFKNVRGSQSFHDLSATANRTDNTHTNSKQTFQRRKRENPIGVKALEKLLEQHPEEIVMQLQVESSGFELMLNNPDDINISKMCLVMQVLAKATETKSNTESLNVLLTEVFKTTFTNFLMRFTIKITLESVEVCHLRCYFENLWVVLDKFCHVMTNLAINQILLLIGSCLMAMQQVSNSLPQELLKKYEDSKTYLEAEKKNWQTQCQEASRGHRRRWQDDLQPPENFRKLPIVPTAIELNDTDVPFLRRNIIHGKYEDAEHYLDVQFRLLREDFVRPLRNGVQEIKKNERSNNRDLYVYRNVQLLGTDIKNFKLIHLVKLTLPGKLQVENSKRLMFGNLVCLTSNNFKTILFGSVAERSPEMLKKGMLGIKIEDQVGNIMGKTFTMVESRSYFTAYKHVLLALQGITEDTFPLESFIVGVDNDMVPPDYVTPETRYDLRVIRRRDMMKTSEVYSMLFTPRKYSPAPAAQEVPALQNVNITRELNYWPSCDDLRVDESQRRALRRALTSKLAIIQGPPGTGKTFIGLKIAQVLLHNSEHWKTEGKKAPILVVCFTNHALDQFLEGMIPFTKSIVRIGARTKSEIIKDFQINSLVKDIRSRRIMPKYFRENSGEIIRHLIQQESEVRTMQSNLQALRNPSGILNLGELIKYGIIPEKVVHQFQKQNLDLTMYLLDPRFINGIDPMLSNTTRPTKAEEEKSTDLESENGDVWYDAIDLYAEEEDGRKLDDDFDMETKGLNCSSSLRHSVTLQGLEASIRDYKNLMEREDVSEREIVMYKQEIHKRMVSLELLTYGLEVPLDDQRAKTLEKYSISSLHFYDRWCLYRLWIDKLAEKFLKDLQRKERKFEQSGAVYSEVKDQEYLYVMRHAAVVGMTTTGAAQYSSILKALQPSVGKSS